jgi:ribosomal protein L14
MAKNEKKTLKPAKVGVRITKAVPVGAQLPCCDNSGAKVLNLFSVKRRPGVLNRLPAASIGDLLICSIRHGKPELKKKSRRCSP